MRKVIFSLTVFFSGVSQAASTAPTWIPFNRSPIVTEKWFLDGASGAFSKDKQGVETSAINYKLFNENSKETKLGRVQVLFDECKKGEGKLTYFDKNGSIEKNEWFVFQAPSISSEIGASLCTMASSVTGIQTYREKSKNPWVALVESQADKFEYLFGTHTIDFDGINQEGKARRYTATLLYLAKPRSNNDKYAKVSVSSTDCKRQRGEISFSDLGYSNRTIENFDVKGKKISDKVAAVLCLAGETINRAIKNAGISPDIAK